MHSIGIFCYLQHSGNLDVLEKKWFTYSYSTEKSYKKDELFFLGFEKVLKMQVSVNFYVSLFHESWYKIEVETYVQFPAEISQSKFIFFHSYHYKFFSISPYLQEIDGYTEWSTIDLEDN